MEYNLYLRTCLDRISSNVFLIKSNVVVAGWYLYNGARDHLVLKKNVKIEHKSWFVVNLYMKIYLFAIGKSCPATMSLLVNSSIIGKGFNKFPSPTLQEKHAKTAEPQL